MAKEKKEVKSPVEDEKEETSIEEIEEETEESEEEETKEEEEKEEEDVDFEKEEDVVSSNKHNQTVRKLREAELEKKKLEKQIEETEPELPKKSKKKVEKEVEEDDFFEDDDDEEEEKEDTSSIVDKKLEPVLAQLKKRDEDDRKKDRTAFFEAHPEYLHDSEKWNGLLDELKNSINPNSEDTYFTQLSKAHTLFSGQSVDNLEIENKKKEMAGDAASGGSEAKSGAAKEEFTKEDRKQMKDFDISEDGMRAAKKKIESGSMRILS